MSNCVYKITTDNGIYIGSCNNLNGRKVTNRRDAKKVNRKLYLNNNIENFKYEILEENIEGNKRLREQHYIDELKPALNRINAYGLKRTHKKYMETYLLRKFNCECGKTVQLQGRARHLRSNIHKKKLKLKNEENIIAV